MNVYAVCIPEERSHYSFEEPPEVGVPLGIFLAETPGQARIDALWEWTHRPMGVYSDDFTAIRVRKISTVREGERGPLKGDETRFWLKWPEGWPKIERGD